MHRHCLYYYTPVPHTHTHTHTLCVRRTHTRTSCPPVFCRDAVACTRAGTIMGRPSWLPVPDFALTTLLGEGASVVLDGQKVLPTKTQQAGFKWQYTEIEPALRPVVN
jgi:NAD dependent epimerase/dehydratase family enzyme